MAIMRPGHIQPVKLLGMGYPGTGKTGSLAALANSGRFKLRILDYDGNHQLLYTYIRPEFWPNVDIVTLEDDEKMGPEQMQTVGVPTALTRGMKMLDRWMYNDPEAPGGVVDLGPVSSWGTDAVLVVDNLTSLGTAAMHQVLFAAARVGQRPQKSDWGTVQGNIEGFIRLAMSGKLKCNVIVFSHLKMVGPPRPEVKEDAEIREWKVEAAEHIPFRLCPNILGQALAPHAAGHFPLVVLYDREVVGPKVKRVIKWEPQVEVDTKLYLPGLAPKLDVADGLLKIFDAALGVGGTPAPQIAPAVATTEGTAK